MEALASGLYQGQLEHARFAPRFHRFSYRVFMAYLDLDEVDRLCQRSWAWSCRHFAPFWIRRADYLGDPALSLKEAVYREVERQAGVRPSGPVRLLTNPRCFGLRMNPISVYYLFAADGESLEFVLAEVTNTPWDQRDLYLLDYRNRQPDDWIVFGKRLHVSPFMPMAQAYHWRTDLPARQLRIQLHNRACGEAVQVEEVGPARKVFEANLVLQRQECNAVNLNAMVWRFPLMTGKVLLGIYWQAMRLWLKGARIYNHPGSGPA